MHTALGALKLVGRWGLVPVKSMVARRACRSIATRTRITPPSSIS